MACVGALKVNYNDNSPGWSVFKLYDNVVAPVKILQSLGVDIFKDMRFDAWALQTLISRIENNMNNTKKGEVMYSAICPLFCMFNHDCDPSAHWTTRPQPNRPGGPLLVFAKRDIKAGEEISVTYIGEIPLESDRRARLVSQIGCVCHCSRCEKEWEDALVVEMEEENKGREALRKFAHRLPDFELFQLNNGITEENGPDEIPRRLRILRARYPSL